MEYGYSAGNIAQMSPDNQERYLSTIAAIVGAGGIVRTGITWNPTLNDGPDFVKYDAFLGRVEAHDLTWLPNIHTTNAVGEYMIPDLLHYQAACQRIAAHYPTITRYEVWNEPDGIGNAGGAMTADTAVALLKAGTMGLRAAQPQVRVIALGLAYTRFGYLDDLYAVDKNLTKYFSAIGVHLYMSTNPLTCKAATTNPHCVQTLPLLREWLDSHKVGKAKSPAIAITEGGYSGADGTRPGNVVTEQQQADWGAAAVDYITENNAELRVSLFSPFNPIDYDSAVYDGAGADYGYWYDNLGAVRASGEWKPWANAYHERATA